MTHHEQRLLRMSRWTRRERYAKRLREHGPWRTEAQRAALIGRRYLVEKIGRDNGYNLPDWCKASHGPKAEQYKRLLHRLVCDGRSDEERQVLYAMAGIKLAHRVAATHSDYDRGVEAALNVIEACHV